MKALEHFPVTIFKTTVENNNILKNILVSEILENCDEMIIPEDWTTNKLKTSFLGEVPGKEVIAKHRDLLKKEYIECMREIFDKEFDVEVQDIWYNVYQDGEYQELHDHLGTLLRPSHFSFIHFLCFDKDQHRSPEFYDPLAQLRNLSLELDSNNSGNYYTPDVKEGDLLMFPSYLEHCVQPGKKTDYPRITLSFNIRVLQYGNNKSY